LHISLSSAAFVGFYGFVRGMDTKLVGVKDAMVRRREEMGCEEIYNLTKRQSTYFGLSWPMKSL
jgi:hypothetical protein